MSEEGLPVVPHITGEFYTWLWWASELNSSSFPLPDPVGGVDVWVEGRMAFRSPGETKVTAVMTGENSSTSLEARAALAGGKTLQDLQIYLRREDREFTVTLKGPEMHTTGIKLPQVVSDGQEEVLYDRMFLYEELNMVLGALFQFFAELRTGPEWEEEVLPQLRAWVWAQA